MAGLLADVYSFGNRTRNKLRGLLDDPIGTLQQAADATAEGVRNLTGQNEVARQFALRDKINAGDKNALAEYKQLQGQVNNKLLDLATNFNPAAVGMTAWHGSPHKFDKFDLAKIGTGEGAQAYGHGAYLAESPNVAQQYQRDISRAQMMQGKVQEFDKLDGKPIEKYYEQIQRKADRLPPAQAELEYEKLAFLEDLMQQPSFSDAVKRIDNDALIPWAKSLESKYQPAGQLYKTDIPDEAVARFLDWDKPLSQQAPEVQKILGFSTRTEDAIHAEAQKIFEEGNKRAGKAGGWSNYPELVERYKALNNELDNIAPNISGADYYRGTDPNNFLHSVLDSANTYPAASADLLSKGIPGIRYLDGGSRAAGQGSSNFVIFDPNMIRILERNGEATGAQPWKPGEWEGLLK